MKSLTILYCVLISSCNYNIQKQNAIPTNEIAFSSGRELSFSSVKEQVLTARCLTCHAVNGSRGSNKGQINLESYQNVFELRDRIRDSVLDGSMPDQSPPLSAYEKKLLLAWLDAGASEFAQNEAAPPPAAPPPPPTSVVVPDIPADKIFYAEVKKYVFTTNCVKCHKPGGRREDFTNYQNIFNNLADIKDQLEIGDMPPPPPKGMPLNLAQKKLILTWMKRGAPEKPN